MALECSYIEMPELPHDPCALMREANRLGRLLQASTERRVIDSEAAVNEKADCLVTALVVHFSPIPEPESHVVVALRKLRDRMRRAPDGPMDPFIKRTQSQTTQQISWRSYVSG